MPQSFPWQNRIVRYGLARVDQLMFNELNWRIHPKSQQAALEAGLRELGWIQCVLINIREDGTEVLVDGHQRALIADAHGEETVPALYVKLTPHEERKALLTLDPLGIGARPDPEKLNELLQDTTTGEAELQRIFAREAKRAGLFDVTASDRDDEGARTSGGTPRSLTCPQCGHNFTPPRAGESEPE